MFSQWASCPGRDWRLDVSDFRVLSARIKFVWDFDWLGADREFREALRLKASHPDARIFAFAGDGGQTLDWLELVLSHRDTQLVYAAADPLFVLVWDDSRFAELRSKMNLPEQRAEK